MNPEDLLYSTIPLPDGFRTEIKHVDEFVTLEYAVTTKDGVENWDLKTITVTSGGPPAKCKVVVDQNVVVAGPAPIWDGEFCMRELDRMRESPNIKWVNQDGYLRPTRLIIVES